MRRSISYCEPSLAMAGEIRNWHFIYTPATTLPKGTRLRFDMQSKGREQIDWELPSINQKNSTSTIFAELDNGKILLPKEVEIPESLTPVYEFTLAAPLQAGHSMTIVLGDREPPKKGSQQGLRAQTNAQRRRSFLLYVDPTGKGKYGEPEVFSLDVKGGELSNIRLLCPSVVSKNKRFDIIVRFEDEYGNLTSSAPEDTLIELSYENIRENLNWKLFVPETGFIALPNLYFNEEGVYTIKLKNTQTNEIFRSPPIKCFNDLEKHVYWGLLHGESDRVDSTENIENCIRHFRDDRAYNFFATSHFESLEETSNDIWKLATQNIAEFNEDERFTTFLGFQWAGEDKSEGLRHIIYPKDNKAILRKKDLKSNTLSKIYKSFSPKEILSIPSFTMAKGLSYDFEDYNPDFERVVEIYNAWGSSETTKKDGNLRPIKSADGNGYQEAAESSIQKALQKNCRFGFVAGGLDDRGVYSELFDTDQEQYSPGLTAIVSQSHTRDAIMQALYDRSCYATTGEKIIVGLSLAGVLMGKEISTAQKQGLVVNRHLSIYVAGTTTLKKVEVIRNGKVIKVMEPKNYHCEFTFDDMEPLEKVCFPSKDKKPPFVYYYIRVLQDDGHMAWSSPIWVDYIPLALLPKTQPKKPPVKQSPLPTSFDEQFDEEEEDDEFDDEEFEEFDE